MLIDFKQSLRDLDGKEIPDAGSEPAKSLTLAKICVDALMAVYKSEENLSGEEKVKRYDLALAIYASETDMDLRAEDVVLIKKLVGQAFPPLVVGQVFKMLN